MNVQPRLMPVLSGYHARGMRPGLAVEALVDHVSSSDLPANSHGPAAAPTGNREDDHQSAMPDPYRRAIQGKAARGENLIMAGRPHSSAVGEPPCCRAAVAWRCQPPRRGESPVLILGILVIG